MPRKRKSGFSGGLTASGSLGLLAGWLLAGWARRAALIYVTKMLGAWVEWMPKCQCCAVNTTPLTTVVALHFALTWLLRLC